MHLIGDPGTYYILNSLINDPAAVGTYLILNSLLDDPVTCCCWNILNFKQFN